MSAPLYPDADFDPLRRSPGKFSGGPLKIVWHKTQGASYPRSTYQRTGSVPHFTVSDTGVWQHFNLDEAATALRNAAGGVQTNFDGAIQIEVVGFSGETAPEATLQKTRTLSEWLEDTLRIPHDWPLGRPPRTADEGYGLHTPYRRTEEWDNVGGHYGHSQVPENTHWDPAWTDEEWTALGFDQPRNRKETQDVYMTEVLALYEALLRKSPEQSGWDARGAAHWARYLASGGDYNAMLDIFVMAAIEKGYIK